MEFIDDLLIILTTGLCAGILCRRGNITPLMGYLGVGVLIGPTVLGWVKSDQEEIEHLAELGVFFLLFSIGLELSLDELKRMGRFLATGGPLQLLLTAAPVAGLLIWVGWSLPASILIASALGFSSTVLVFKALGEMGQTNTDLGRRAIAILLFQDAALVPLLLCVPLLAGTGEATGVVQWIRLGMSSVLFLGATFGLRLLLTRTIIPRITQHRSPDLVVLLTLTMLGAVTLTAHRMGLPPAIGAFAAGLAFGGNRWSEQIDSLILPFREAFSAVFFVSLGLLVNLVDIVRDPLVAVSGILILMAIKSFAATVAFRATGISWKKSFAPSLGLAHVGEFAFVLILLAASSGVITSDQRQQVLAIAGGTLLLSPFLIRFGFGKSDGSIAISDDSHNKIRANDFDDRRLAIVIGMGPVGRAVVSRMETLGHEICAIDINPLNLQAFNQFGIPTVTGDAEASEVLTSAGIQRAQIAIVCVPVDEVALRTTRAIRKMNRDIRIVVRCRYARNADEMRKGGADFVFSEEAYAAIELVRMVDG
jgi:CPA2 family monovalent cation:H+ antiporter-2